MIKEKAKNVSAHNSSEYPWCMTYHFPHLNTTFEYKYRVIHKKVSFGVFWIFLIFKEEKKNLTLESLDKVLSLSKFLQYLAIVNIIKIRHSEGHISQKNHDLNIIFKQK